MVERIQTRTNSREYQLDISVPTPLGRRLNLDARTEKEILREKALNLKDKEGFGYGMIGKKLGLEKWKVQRLLSGNKEG